MLQLQEIIENLNQRNPELRLKDSDVYHVACQLTKRPFTWRTWNNWKNLPLWEKGNKKGAPIVRPYSEKLTLGQSLVLMAIAYSRIDPETLEPLNSRKPLPSNEEINWILHNPIPGQTMELGFFLEGCLMERKRTWRYTKELPIELEKRGYSGVGLRSLYKKLGDMIRDKQKHYPVHIEQYCQALDSMRQAKAS